MFCVTLVLTRYITEEILLLVAFVIITIGSLVIAFPLKQTTIMSSFSKILGSKPQGGLMGWIGVFGSIGRIVMPLLSSLQT
eukprot:Pgem_evm1s2896